MTNGQLNYLRMISTSRGVLDITANALIWSGNAWVVTAKGDVKTIFDRILGNAGITEAYLHGNTEVKEILWHDTAELGVHLSVGTKVWAENKTVPDPVLAAAMHYQMSDLDRGAIQDVLVKLNFIAGKVALIPALELASANILATEISTYTTKLAELTVAAPQYRVQQTAKTTATSDIVADFILLRAAKKKQNNLIYTYKLTQSSFVKSYVTGSEIINLGKGMNAQEAIMHPKEHVAWFQNEFVPGDTLTLRNHSVLANVKIYLSETTDVPATGGFQIDAQLDFKLSIPTDFNCPFGHYIIVVNLSGFDDAHVTGILAKGVSASSAPTPPLA